MRIAYRLVFVSMLVASSLGCETSDSSPMDGSDAAADGGQHDAGADSAASQPEPRELDSSVRLDAETDAQREAAADAGRPQQRDSEADSDGGVDPGGTGIRYAGGDGSSCEKAVVILGAHSDFEGTSAEYDWLAMHYPGAKVLDQALGKCGGHWADILRVRTARGETLMVYFDIADFFGN